MTSYPDELELKIERMAQGGDGVGRWEGRVVFATGGLPGERVRVRIHERKAGYARGTVVQVLTPSPDRVEPRLPGADHIPWQHIAYTAQLRFKQGILREQLAKFAKLPDAPVLPVLPAAQPWNYRNTTHLHVQGNRVGYYAAGTHQVIDLEEDPLLLPVLNDALRELRALLADVTAGVEAVTLRASATEGRTVALVRGTGDLEELARRWQARVPSLTGIIHTTPTPADPSRSAVMLREELGGVVFVLTPNSFFQSHTAQAETLLRVVRAGLALQPGERLLDAYSGVGTFALPLARAVREVVAIEENRYAVADGEHSAHLNNITNVRFITAPVERALPLLDAPFDAVVLDPPRRGCHPAALQALGAQRPPRIAYVSCHPGILGRDLRALLDAGYRLVEVQPVDLFPQTPHIECVALLRRAGDGPDGATG